MLVRRASDHIINPEFECRQSDGFVVLVEKMKVELKLQLDAVVSAIASPQKRMILQGFLHGLDTGLMNILLYIRESRPIKRKRLMTLVQFFEDLLNYVNEYIFMEELFNEFTTFSDYIMAGMMRDPVELIRTDPHEENLTMAM
jgi:hypothetical protein